MAIRTKTGPSFANLFVGYIEEHTLTSSAASRQNAAVAKCMTILWSNIALEKNLINLSASLNPSNRHTFGKFPTSQ